jgi:hypothetical protein
MRIGAPDGKPFELTGALRDTSGYRNVYFPPLACRYQGSNMPDTWYKQTGAEYARDRKGSEEPPCPRT